MLSATKSSPSAAFCAAARRKVGGSFSSPAAVAGYPHLTVPAGNVHGLPVGLSFVGPAWSDARLLALGDTFEQATLARRTPRFT